MKKLVMSLVLAVSAVWPVSGSLIYSSGNVNGSGTSLNTAIPDGNPSGISFGLNVSGATATLTVVTVTLNISGGYNGNLYAYLAYNGTLVTLLNRVGTGSGGPIQQTFGFSTTGFNNVLLSDAGTDGNIHNIATPGSGPTYAYTPDGGSLASFNGLNPNGTWTLFISDMSAGNVSTMNGWSLDITAVPEPVEVALGVFGVCVAITWLVRCVRGGFSGGGVGEWRDE